MTTRYSKITFHLRTLISDPYKWGKGYNYCAISSDCQLIAVRPLSNFEDSDERYERVYLYSGAGNELTNFRSPHGGEGGILFWPDDEHLLIPGYDYGKQDITVMQRSLRDSSLNFPLQHTQLEGTAQHIISGSKNGRYLAGWSSSPGSNNKCWYYDTATQKLVTKLEFANKAVFSINEQLAIFMTKHTYLPNEDFNLYLLNLTTGQKVHPNIEKVLPTPSQVQEAFLCFSSDTNYCLFGKRAGVIIRDLPDLQVVRTVNLNTETFSCGCASEDGNFFVLGCVNGDIYVLSANDFKVIGHYISGSAFSGEEAIRHVQLSSDNRSVVAVNRNTVSVYGLEYS